MNIGTVSKHLPSCTIYANSIDRL